MKKGQMTNLALGVITTLVLLFAGLYAIVRIAGIQPQSDLYDYVYNTTTNSTTGTINQTTTQERNFTIGTIASIERETADSQVIVVVENVDPSDSTVNVSMNGTSLGTFTATAGTNTTGTLESVDFTENALHILLIGDNVADMNNTLQSVAIRFPRDMSSTTIGTIFSSLTTNTATIFDVLILVIIVVALGVAIAVLKGFGGSKETSPI